MNLMFQNLKKKIKELIILYFLKKQIIINFFLFFIKRINLESGIGTELLKNDFHNELNRNIFFTTRSMLNELGNFTQKKEYPNKKTSHFNKKNQEIFFVKSSELKVFVNDHLHKINNNFILVTGDSDTEIRVDTNQKDSKLRDSINHILNNSNLVVWYAQNLFFDHKKIKNIPHGVDYHTIWEKRKSWENHRFSPSHQEKELISTLFKSKPFKERESLIFNNWHFSMSHGNRKEIYDKISKKNNFFPEKRVNRFLNWELQSKFKYIFCPSGKGLDDSRTYESIILGNIPIRIEDELSKFHEDLPIIYLKNLEDLNIKTVESKYSEFQDKKFNFQILFLDYWRSQLNLDFKDNISNFKNITMIEFRRNIIEYYFSN